MDLNDDSAVMKLDSFANVIKFKQSNVLGGMEGCNKLHQCDEKGCDEHETDSDESGIKMHCMFKGQEDHWGSCPRCDGGLFTGDEC